MRSYNRNIKFLAPWSTIPAPLPSFESIECIAHKPHRLSFVPNQMFVAQPQPSLPTYRELDYSLWIEPPPPNTQRTSINPSRNKWDLCILKYDWLSYSRCIIPPKHIEHHCWITSSTNIKCSNNHYTTTNYPPCSTIHFPSSHLWVLWKNPSHASWVLRWDEVHPQSCSRAATSHISLIIPINP